ncbi:MAG: Trp biosynthesis-associated membrane protein [Ornithinimicrobium sp.]
MRRLSVFALLCGLLIAVVSTGRTWLVVATTDLVLGEVSIDASGNEVSPALTGALVLAGAATLVAVLTRGWPRRISSLVLALAAAWAGYLAASVLVDPRAAAASAGRSEVGVPGGLGSGAATVSGVEVSVWPWVLTFAAALIMVGVAGSMWAGLRPEPMRIAAGSDPAGPDRGAADLPATERRRRENARAWDDLSDGKDLTP